MSKGGPVCFVLAVGAAGSLAVYLVVDYNNWMKGSETFNEIKEIICNLNEGELQNFKLDDIIINDVLTIGAGVDQNNKYCLDVICTELGKSVQYKYSYGLSDDYINSNLDKFKSLKNYDGFVDSNTKLDDDVKHDKDAMKSFYDVIMSGNLVEISKAEGENEKFKVVATASDIADYKAYDIKETKTGELYAVPYEKKGSNASDYSMQ